MTFFFLIVILGATHGRAPKGFAPIAIGLCLTLIHLVTIPVTNTSVNPARSTGPAMFVQGWALNQLWLFWVAPILGAMLAGFVYTWMVGDDEIFQPEPVVGGEQSDNEENTSEVIVIEETIIETADTGDSAEEK